MANLKSPFRESAVQMAVEGDTAESSAKESEYDSDPLLENRFFYSVPFDLLASVVQIIGQNRFDERLIELDLSLSARPPEVHKRAVRWHGQWIAYEFLSNRIEQTSERDPGKWSQQDQS